MQSHWDKLPTIRVVDAGYLLAGMEPERKWQFAPPLVANFFNLIREKTGAVKLATMPGERMEITRAEFQALKAEYGATPATEPQATTPSPAPVLVETTEQRRARWLDWYGKGERGAVQRVYERELLLNPKADRSFIGKEIDKAKSEKAETKRGGAMFGQLVQGGKRMG